MQSNKLDIEIGKRLMDLRKSREETQKELAAAIGINNRETINQWESGERKIKAEYIILLAKHYKVSSDYLLGLSNVPSVEPSMQEACAYTGLSQEAIEHIRKMGLYANEISSLISTDSFESLVINYYAYSCQLIRFVREAEDPLTDPSVLMNAFSTLELIEYKSHKALGGFLESVKKAELKKSRVIKKKDKGYVIEHHFIGGADNG